MAQPTDNNLLNSFLQEESERLTGLIDQKITPTSPWLSQIRKKTWRGEIGHVISNVMWERSFPKTQAAWTQYLSNKAPASASNICIPNIDRVEFNQTVRTTNLAAKAIESPDFCIEDLRAKWKRDEQMGLVMNNLADVTKHYNIRRNRMAFMGACDTKLIPTASGFSVTDEKSIIAVDTREDYGDALFGDVTPGSVITQGMLDALHSKLDREDAGNHGTAQSGGGFVYKLVTSAEHSSYLRKGNADIREDFRNSSHADVLLKGMGVTATWGGFAHIIDPLPRRWEKHAMGGAFDATNGWEEIMPYVEKDDGAGGTITGNWVINPLYETATYEDGVILITAVLDMLVPAPITKSAQATFKSQNYQGEYSFMNIADRVENPDGTIGFFRGKIVNGFQTRHPELGICFRHQRVPFELEVDDVNA